MNIGQLINLGVLGGGEIIFMFLLIIPYFIPSYIAFSGNSKNKNEILILNLVLGWTVIGWLVCLVWALRKDSEPQSINITNTSTSEIRQAAEPTEIGKTQNYDGKLQSIQKLKELFDAGVLSEEEFKTEKTKILSS